MTATTQLAPQWCDLCGLEDLVENSGICALVNNQQVAIFTVNIKGEQQIFAISNWDPVGKANVLYRGLLGSVGEEIVVASPLYKEHYSLTTGRCLERDDVSVIAYKVRREGDRLQIAIE
ncbi:nitrite reductase small subunit NirD [Alteromonas sp. 345S023]|jgi:nitrite reductase (NADH) small subunit|uniref:Nitrite reductase small subunit NirD n=1 Tax=Alteromonas profundi TaxID=2696062 RepID=A0A7X5LLG5_9ALTE|nr:nitrite reductase small subunit NirD [Alteromonas profundi]NDV91528.1 nitrite reductase small subunit NirD [Alteromonas profundi]